MKLSRTEYIFGLIGLTGVAQTLIYGIYTMVIDLGLVTTVVILIAVPACVVLPLYALQLVVHWLDKN